MASVEQKIYVPIPNKWSCRKCDEVFFSKDQPALCPNCGSDQTNCYSAGLECTLNDLTPAIAADALIQEMDWTARRDDDSIFLFNRAKGIYEAGESHARELCASIAGIRATPRFYSDAIGVLASKTYDAVPEPPLELLAVENGILDIKTLTLAPHSPEYFFLQKIPVKYDPLATCPHIDKFLSEVVSPEHCTTLIEFAGFCLWRSYRIEKAIIAPGSGANGKSIWATVLSRFLGQENVTNMTLQILCENRFASANLYGKLANFAPDLPGDALRDVGMFKGLTGGDAISGEHKFKRPFSFLNYAKFFFGCNQIPRTNDRQDGYFRRFIIVPFPNQFLSNARNREDLIAELTTPGELSGLLNHALEGLASIQKNNRFTYEQSIDEIRETYLKASEPVTAFVYDACELDAEAETRKADLYAAYAVFCRERHFAIENEIKFGRSLKQVADVQECQLGTGKERKTAWRGIRVKEAQQPKQSQTSPQLTLTQGNENAQ